MNKYAILILINLPLLIIGVIGAITSYKTKRISKKRMRAELVVWLVIAVGLIFVEPFYNVLIRANLTDSPSMSIFDMVLLTSLLFCLLLIKNSNEKLNLLNRKISRMHEHLAFRSDEEKS